MIGSEQEADRYWLEEDDQPSMVEGPERLGLGLGAEIASLLEERGPAAGAFQTGVGVPRS